MKALLLAEYKKLELTDIPQPEIGPDDILVQVAACGICGSDIHGWDGSSGRRQPPLVMGHEAAGTVAAVGNNVTGFKEGERITFDSTVWCGKCPYCLSGRPNLCDNRMVLGVSCDDYRRYGCFAEYVSVPARICCKLPDALSFEHAALIEAVCCGRSCGQPHTRFSGRYGRGGWQRHDWTARHSGHQAERLRPGHCHRPE